MKAFGSMGLKRSRRGFTLIELLIVMVILAILAGVVVMAVGGVFGTAHESAYESVKPQIQNGVIEYATAHDGDTTALRIGAQTTVDTPDGAVNVWILAMCNITGGDRILRTVPDGCYTVAGAANDNCDGANASAICTGCAATNHYIWYIDNGGNVYSKCFGADCTLNGNDSYQGVWP